ncbi:DUF2807 domain-containing protein [Dokdonia sinensis]|uniref:DUF2807 domain-containing protein n=1 Tax=Dokdonia sinensis TaxID=2479847 RepID=A0A3M0FV53_9FLAO|nr:head GIN domain-containing protein [Dokdonia sinensis]RMB56670.1 DUF2807 domain-containing protein [Dokdonia sinensis]
MRSRLGDIGTCDNFTFVKMFSRPIIAVVVAPLLLVLSACDSGDAGLCFDDTTAIAEREVTVPDFEQIIVGENVSLILSQGPQAITVEAPESYIDDVAVTVKNGTLFLADQNRCDLLRESAPTTIRVTAPNITRIRNASQYEVVSDGVLAYDSLILVSDLNENARYSVGEFRMELDVTSFEVISNNISNFYISGRAENALIGFYAGSGRYEGAGVLVDNLRIFHRGSNVMIVNPITSITGEIRSNGNVIAKNRPETVDVQELERGRLIFE